MPARREGRTARTGIPQLLQQDCNAPDRSRTAFGGDRSTTRDAHASPSEQTPPDCSPAPLRHRGRRNRGSDADENGGGNGTRARGTWPSQPNPANLCGTLHETSNHARELCAGGARYWHGAGAEWGGAGVPQGSNRWAGVRSVRKKRAAHAPRANIRLTRVGGRRCKIHAYTSRAMGRH